MTDYSQRRTTMVDTQVRPSDVTSFPVIDAMLTVPREDFVPTAARELAYLGGPITIEPDRQILEPRTIGKMLQALQLQRSEMVLEVAPGLGYTTALLGRMAEAVVAVEENAALAAEAEDALRRHEIDNAAVLNAPHVEGAVKHGPFDVLAIFAGVEEVPAPLLQQLKEGGRAIAIFMEGAVGEARIGVRVGGTISWRASFNATAPVLAGFARERRFAL